MRKERFDFVCSEAEEGRDAFVTHPGSSEEGRVESCSMDHVTVQTSSGTMRCWDYAECEEIARGKGEWPRR